MKPSDIALYRLLNQKIAVSSCRDPAEVVAWLGAMQSQDFTGALWSIGLRLAQPSEKAVQEAVVKRTIVRTWPMRGTLHFVAADDVRWMLRLLTPRIIAGSARRHQELELDDKVFARCRKVFEKALGGERQLTRDAMIQELERANIAVSPHRAYHIFWRLAQEATLCFGVPEGKQQTFALLDEWVPEGRNLDRDESLAELARRYFVSHGPATLRDFVWWSGLKVSDAKAGLDCVGTLLHHEIVDGVDYWMGAAIPTIVPAASAGFLLPGFDEFLLGYANRSATLDPLFAQKIVPGSNGIFLPPLVVKGKVVGTWKRTEKTQSMTITATPFATLKNSSHTALAKAARRYGTFAGKAVELKAVKYADDAH